MVEWDVFLAALAHAGGTAEGMRVEGVVAGKRGLLLLLSLSIVLCIRREWRSHGRDRRGRGVSCASRGRWARRRRSSGLKSAGK